MPMQSPLTTNRNVRAGGILLVDKPGGMTSHDVVAAIRRLVRPLKVGHTGTLDPLASGLLILCIGAATRITGFVAAQYKLYKGTALLGVRTDTQDVTGAIIAQKPTEALTEQQIRTAADLFVGAIEQTPPPFSAVKVGGVRAYRLARKKKEVHIESRQIEIRRLEIEGVSLPRVHFLVECSKGTYVRTLCSDLGDELGVGGCLESLRRLAIGGLSLDNARSLSELSTREAIERAMLPASKALEHMPAFACTEEQVLRLSHGMRLSVSGQIEPGEAESSWILALGPRGDLLAVGRLSIDGGDIFFQPKKVLMTGEGQ